MLMNICKVIHILLIYIKLGSHYIGGVLNLYEYVLKNVFIV